MSAEEYVQIDIDAPAAQREILLAFLGELPFESFEELDTGLRGYLPAAACGPAFERQLEELRQHYAFTYSTTRLAPRNWNEEWERNFQPIRVGDFCGIRADFHAPLAGVAHELIINPRMAFGTGHHATTYMMIEMMETLDWAGATVLDFGCGTGILAILAARLGAAAVEAVDIEEPAVENARENALINGVPAQLTIRHGDLSAVAGAAFNRILANINRNVILASLSALYDKLTPGGNLLISGILKDDEALLRERAAAAGFRTTGRRERGDWICLGLTK